MARLNVNTDQPTRENPRERRDAQAAPPATASRPCPRCLVSLVLDRRVTATGLSGKPSTFDDYVCPACDARYRHNHADGKWREIGES